MSHSENNMTRQLRRHKGPLLGFIAIFIFIAVLTVWWIGKSVSEAEAPEGAETQIDSRTGEPVDTEPLTVEPAVPVSPEEPVTDPALEQGVDPTDTNNIED